jgi:hypothetical protein
VPASQARRICAGAETQESRIERFAPQESPQQCEDRERGRGQQRRGAKEGPDQMPEEREAAHEHEGRTVARPWRSGASATTERFVCSSSDLRPR